MHKHEKLTKREKAIIGAAVVTTCIAGYFGYKYFSEIKMEKLLQKDVDTLMEAASEGVFEEALATVGRKISYRKDREQYLLKQLDTHPGESDLSKCLERVQSELTVLAERRFKFANAQKLYGIEETLDV